MTPLEAGTQRMLKYHSSWVANGWTPRVTGWSGRLANWGFHIGFTLKRCS